MVKEDEFVKSLPAQNDVKLDIGINKMRRM